MATPKYRDDIKGEVALHIADFESGIVGELNNPERMDFLMCVEDSAAYAEHKDTLTLAEMKAAFKRAQRRASVSA